MVTPLWTRYFAWLHFLSLPKSINEQLQQTSSPFGNCKRLMVIKLSLLDPLYFFVAHLHVIFDSCDFQNGGRPWLQANNLPILLHCKIFVQQNSFNTPNNTCFWLEGSWLHIFPRILVTSWNGRSWFSALTFSRCSLRNLTYPVRGALGAFKSLSGFFLFFPLVNIGCKLKTK